MTDQEARDEREALIARAREVSGALEEYEFEGAAGEAAGLLNSLADALDRKHPEPEWEYGYAGGDWEPAPLQEGINPDIPRTHRREKAGPWVPVA